RALGNLSTSSGARRAGARLALASPRPRRGGLAGVAEAIESGQAMKAISLFGVFALARALVLLGRDIPLSLWSPVAYLWQDLLAVLLFAGFERVTARRPWISWMVYVAIVLYIAINLPLVRYLSSPLTLPMLRATRGALADSIRHQLTGENLGLIGLMLCAAAALPPSVFSIAQIANLLFRRLQIGRALAG